jgi:hypothetical protein
MKAITIWQPWASLIMAGAKPYEFRGWRLPSALIGQRLVIHAGAHRIAQDELDFLLSVMLNHEIHRDLAAETCLIPDRAIPVLELACRGKLPRSVALGTVLVGETRLGTEVAQDFYTLTGGMEGAARASARSADQEPNWGWQMLDPDPWESPVPMRGRQGLWNWPTPEQLFAHADGAAA